MSYLTSSELRIPAEFDPKIVKASLKELHASKVWARIADAHTVRVALEHARSVPVLRHLGMLCQNDPALAVAFHRHVPEKYWKATDPHGHMAPVMALARGIPDTRPWRYSKDPATARLTLSEQLMAASDDELRTIVRALGSPTVLEWKLEGPAITARIVSMLDGADHAISLWSRLDFLSRGRFIKALPDDWVMALEQATRDENRNQSHAYAAFELAARGLVSGDAVEACIELARKLRPESALDSLFAVPIPGMLPERAPEQEIASIREAGRHLRPHAAPLRAFFAERRGQQRSPGGLDIGPTLFVLALTFDEAGAAWLVELCRSNEAWARERYQIENLGRALGNAAIAAEGPDQMLAAIGSGLTRTRYAEVVAIATAQLANHRAALDAGGAITIAWDNTRSKEAQHLLGKATDPRAVVDAGLRSAGPVGTLNALASACTFVAEARMKPGFDEAAARARWGWDFVESAVRALEARYGVDAPDGEELMARLGAEGRFCDANRGFQEAFEFFARLHGGDGRDAFIARVLVPLVRTTKNVRFRGWTTDLVRGHGSDEPVLARIERLAREASAEGGPTVRRSFLVRGTAAPSAHQVNRLYGPPIGFADDAPTFEGQPMRHVVTVSERCLGGAGGDGAVAVFVSSLSDHQAFFPDTAHAAVVWLGPEDLAKGAAVIASDDPTVAGVALEAITVEIPEAVLDRKARLDGARFELREELSRTDVLQPGRAPLWIQEPEGSDEFLFDLDGTFAPEVNLGDCGRMYVFGDTAFAQSG
jgi:hypothetical protein